MSINKYKRLAFSIHMRNAEKIHVYVVVKLEPREATRETIIDIRCELYSAREVSTLYETLRFSEDTLCLSHTDFIFNRMVKVSDRFTSAVLEHIKLKYGEPYEII